jgi:hypothetical protein
MRSILVAVVLLAGCASPVEEAPPATEPIEPLATPLPVASNASSASPDLSSWRATECQEVHGKFLFEPAEYEGVYPPGFTLILEAGMVTIQTVTFLCSEGHMHLVALLVEPPAERKWGGATHGLMMGDVWVGGPVADLMRDAGVTAQSRAVEMTKMGVLSGLGALIKSDPDFVMNINANPTEAGAMAEQIRFFGAFWNEETQTVEVTPNRALDLIRSPSLSWAGPATAHFLPLLDGGLLPFDQVGTGAGSFETLPISLSAVYA